MQSSTAIQLTMIVSCYTRPFQLNHQKISSQILYETKESIFKQSAPIAHCISADAKMQKGFADSLSKRFPEVRGACRSAKLMKG